MNITYSESDVLLNIRRNQEVDLFDVDSISDNASSPS